MGSIIPTLCVSLYIMKMDVIVVIKYAGSSTPSDGMNSVTNWELKHSTGLLSVQKLNADGIFVPSRLWVLLMLNFIGFV